MSEPGVETEAGATGADAPTGDLTAEETAEAEGQLGQIVADDPDQLKAEMNRWKGLAQRHERTARENADAAKKWREQEDANKTELQRATEAQQAAEERARVAEMQTSRMVAAATHDLDPELIDFIGDGTPDEINARAESLAGIIERVATKKAESMAGQNGNGNGRQPTGRRPVESMRPGAAPAGTGVGTPDQMFRQLISGGDL